MRKSLLPIFILLLLSGCANKIIPLKGNYFNPPYQITTNATFEEVWDKLIDLFAQKGLSIKIIDRSSGFIASEKSILSYTIETKDGNLKDPNAFIVVPKVYNSGSRKYYPVTSSLGVPTDVYGEWNVRVKHVNEQTVINVNIVNVSYFQKGTAYKTTSGQVLLANYKSTGVFEKLIADIIK